MLAMFFFSGLGNAGTFKQMPMIMPKRQAGGAIGFTAAIASLGPFIVGVAIASLGATTWYWLSVAYCALCAVVCWIRYARPGASKSSNASFYFCYHFLKFFYWFTFFFMHLKSPFTI